MPEGEFREWRAGGSEYVGSIDDLRRWLSSGWAHYWLIPATIEIAVLRSAAVVPKGRQRCYGRLSFTPRRFLDFGGIHSRLPNSISDTLGSGLAAQKANIIVYSSKLRSIK